MPNLRDEAANVALRAGITRAQGLDVLDKNVGLIIIRETLKEQGLTIQRHGKQWTTTAVAKLGGSR